MIPQSNPKANYLAHKAEIDATISRVLESGWYILGNEVSSFEREFAESMESAYAVGVARLSNGVQVLAWVRETDPSKLRVGMKVRLEVVKREPEGYLTYELVPVEG